jgi:type II secretory pathway component PulC
VKVSCRLSCSLLVVALVACGGGATESNTPRPAASTATLPPGSLARADVVRVVDAGLGRFLQRARVEPSLEEGRFVGFKIIELVPDSFWGDTDLRPGDVVTHVNGQFVEDPNQAFEVFESLRSAQTLEVRVLRDGKAKTLRFPIVGPPAPTASAATTGG